MQGSASSSHDYPDPEFDEPGCVKEDEIDGKVLENHLFFLCEKARRV